MKPKETDGPIPKLFQINISKVGIQEEVRSSSHARKMKINILSSEMPHGEFSQRQYHEVFTGLRTNVKRPATYRSCWPLSSYGAEGETRTPTPIRALDPEPSVSTNSTTSAIKARAIYSKREMPLQGKNGGGGLGTGGWENPLNRCRDGTVRP